MMSELQLRNRPSLIDYDPVANASAVVTSPDGMARFTVLTPRLIRMEYAHAPGSFEDMSTIAVCVCVCVVMCSCGHVFVSSCVCHGVCVVMWSCV
jgi:hypothetical protein